MNPSINPSKATSDRQLEATARWTAAVRAAEQERPDCLFYDPWAKALAGEEGAAWLQGRSPESLAPIAIRTRFYDDYLRQTTSLGHVRQVVLLAAGLDTRAYRLGWPNGTRLFEVDQPWVMQYKTDLLQSLEAVAACERQVIAADLTGTWEPLILNAGFDPQAPSAWLLEGFLFYLPNPAILQILEGVSRMATPGSWLGFDMINAMVLTSPWTKAWVEMQAQAGAPWIGSLEDPEATLGSLGWTVTLTSAGQPEANFGRWSLPVMPPNLPNVPHQWLVTAQKRTA